MESRAIPWKAKLKNGRPLHETNSGLDNHDDIVEVDYQQNEEPDDAEEQSEYEV
jgi:hypothetical protein